MDSSGTSVVCSYEGAGDAGEGGLSWAQQFMSEAIRATGAEVGSFDILVTREPQAPLSVEKAVDVVRRLIMDHPILRTSISHDGLQRIDGSGKTTIPVRQEPLTGDLREHISPTTLEHTFSVLFVARGDEVVRIGMRVNHLVADAYGVKALAGGHGSASPLELVRFEESGEGREVQRRSLEHAAAVYASAPATMWPRRQAPQPQRFWLGDLRSADLLTALDRLRWEKSVTRAGALIGALALVTAHQAGTDSALLFMISGNRHDPKWTDYPGLLAQEAVLHVPIGDTVGETIRTATAVAARALRNARYKPSEMDRVRREAEQRRGVTFDGLGTAVVLNLLSPDTTPQAAVPSSPATFAWRDTTDDENLGLFVDAYQTPEGFVLGGRADTTLLNPKEMEALLRAVEWAIVSAAEREVPKSELDTYLFR